MTLDEGLARVGPRLNGRAATEEEIVLLKSSLSDRLMPEWLSGVIRTHRLIGVRMSLSEKDDQSGIGVEMLWQAPSQMLAEINDSEPGLSVCSQGFLPIGACATGSGDPYFLDLRDIGALNPPVVRIRHDLAGKGAYPAESIEPAASTLSRFFLQVVIT